MAAKPNYPSGYLRQLIYPFTRDGGCTLTPSTAATNGTEASAPDPSEKQRCTSWHYWPKT